MEKRIYLDYAATTPLAEEVNRAVYAFGQKDTGNPSSPHRFGQQAKILLEDARDVVAAGLNCKPGEIIFTSGGTESNNAAITGTLNAVDSIGKHIILSALEHPSVLETAAYLERIGFEISLIQPDANGLITPVQVGKSIRPDTVLASIMYVNNETGIVHDSAGIAEICHKNNIIVHCDAVQAFGKIPLDTAKLNADLLSVSAHKVYGPKGIGALIIKKGTPFSGIHFGGGQEANRRPGTENLAGVIGFAEAVKLLEQSKKDMAYAGNLQRLFESAIKQEIPSAVIIGEQMKRTSFISAIAFPGIHNENMLLNLDLAGIAVSVGSACSSGSIKQSHVLKAMALPDEIINSTIRFSYGRYTKPKELDETVNTIKQIIKRLA
ncbi:MAG TPA: cysteine desulfurase [Caldithrix sp.]|nr:cysteine desulfurase [Caldithrix sp.]